VRKAFEFAKSFLKSASSNPLLLLDNGFLGAMPRAFESWPEPARQFWKPARANSPILKASQSQLADFESRPEPILLVFKSFSQIQKLFALNGKEFINSI
jgi:hypothetical protein